MIEGIKNPIQIDSISKQTPINTSKTEGKTFESFYNAAMGLLEQTNEMQQKADQKSVEFAMGKIDDIHSVTLAHEQANLLLQFTVQVRNKFLESYKEIMRMPV